MLLPAVASLIFFLSQPCTDPSAVADGSMRSVAGVDLHPSCRLHCARTSSSGPPKSPSASARAAFNAPSTIRECCVVHPFVVSVAKLVYGSATFCHHWPVPVLLLPIMDYGHPHYQTIRAFAYARCPRVASMASAWALSICPCRLFPPCATCRSLMAHRPLLVGLLPSEEDMPVLSD